MNTPLPITALSLPPTTSFTELAARYLEEYREKIELGTRPLDFDQLWWRPASSGNSVANLLLHLRGNLSLWILNGLGGESFERDRSGEFRAERSADRVELMAALDRVVEAASSVVRALPPEVMTRRYTVQRYDVSGLEILFHAVEHMSYHTGQILYISKQLRSDAGLEFYPQHRGE